MTLDLRNALPSLLPEAIAWAEARAYEAAASGMTLDDSGVALARAVSVVHPERIRVLLVESLPLPDDPNLREAALEAGLLGPGMVGLTLGYSVMICEGHVTDRLMSHREKRGRNPFNQRERGRGGERGGERGRNPYYPCSLIGGRPRGRYCKRRPVMRSSL